MSSSVFPETHRVRVPASLADELFAAAERLPTYDNKEYYSTELQTSIYQQIRQGNVEGFDWLVKQIQERLDQRPYSVIVEGMRFYENNCFFVAINRAFGTLVARPYKKPRAQLVHYIQPATDILASKNTRYETEKLHTDTADWDPPVKLISMVCVRPAPSGGGRSLVLDVDAIREEVASRLGMETMKLLESEAVPWQLAPYRGGGVVWRPILTESTVCWRYYTIEQALNGMDAELSAQMSVALHAFGNMLADTPHRLEFLMGAGELLFLDNWRTLHARTSIDGGKDSNRLMIRSWIKTSE